jgi:4-hydroxybenzoate polyprenyltransferase
MRPRHWVKNLFLFAPPFFGGKLMDPIVALTALPAFAAFCLGASSAYVLNDVIDLDRDRLHPSKKDRPLANGAVSGREALWLAFFLAAASIALAYAVEPGYVVYVLAYLAIQAAYSLHFKDVAVVDLFFIASGFVIRVVAGGAAFRITVSKWLLLTMFMISLTLAAGKRLGEAQLLDDRAQEHRKSLGQYTSGFLNDILLVAASSSMMSYAMYTVEQFPRLIYTVPIVTFGLLKYLMLARSGKGDPTDGLMQDRWLAVSVAAWLLLVGFIRYA